ncbi:MAG: DEAD/DEAH box helicase family protein [Chitinophagaceae bacterium]|nr:DEAD/DEAH box helicase family protein [Chitinophagaceae bacterium]
MLKEVEWSIDRSYRTGGESEPVQFYMDGLCHSKNFDLLLGYFSSAAINVLSLGFATFLYSGGKVRIVVNNIFSQEDRNAIWIARDGDVEDTSIDLSDIKQLKRTLDDYGKHFFECLAWLIAKERIQIKIVRPKSGRGIAHYKSGIFSDGSDSVGFKASCNFTAYGLLENLEELDAFLSWENSRSSKMINRQNTDFENLFSGKADFVDYLEVEDISIAIKKEFGSKSVNELVIQEKELLDKKSRVLENKGVRKSFEKAITRIEEIQREPKFPYSSGAREYQIDAYESWLRNGRKGIFAMATGTGKTITSLNCVLEEVKKNPDKIYHVLILVPTITLVNQWEKEVLSFNFQEVFKISSRVDWQNTVTTLISTSKKIPISFVLISTYASFVKDKFQNLIKDLPDDTIFIADEGHNLASPMVAIRIKDFKLKKRIGLSATPKRIYDPEGTAEMEVFFGEKEPYTYSFSMERAIREGVLCQYYYFPHIIKLTEIEMKEYVDISIQLSKLYRFGKGNPEKENIIERLLLKRKRIIHKASNKLGTVIEILKEQFRKKGNLKYTFVYVPEGDTFEINEDDDEQVVENIRLINQFTREIARIDDKILVNQFISGMKNRDEILKQFQNGEIDVIASMKCLDEGVDIPRAETALFCSSTGNPRQFIQRRGRILRTHEAKNHAMIYDLVVMPDYENDVKGSETYDLERGLVKKELERVMYFSSLAKNPFFTEDVFKDVCKHYDLNIYTIQNELASV